MKSRPRKLVEKINNINRAAETSSSSKRRFFSPLLTGGVVIVTLIALVACDRESRHFGAGMTKVKSATMPESYTELAKNDAHPFAVAGPGVVRDVLPQGDEGISGEGVFIKNCSACHQVSGQGIKGAFPPLVNSPYVTGPNVERLAAIMVYGLMGPINVLGDTYAGVMAPLGGALNDEELSAVATYIRSAWGNKAEPVGPEVFAAVRQKWGSRSMFNIQELGEEK